MCMEIFKIKNAQIPIDMKTKDPQTWHPLPAAVNTQ